MNFRPAGYSSEEDDFDEFDGFSCPTYKPCNTTSDNQHDMDNTRQGVDEEIPHMDKLKNAILFGNVDDLKENLNSVPGFDVNAELENINWTPLIYACSLGNPEIVSELLNFGADPNIHKDSYTPLMAVCSNESPEDDHLVMCAEYLLQFGAKTDVSNRFGITPLMFASLNGHKNLVIFLLPFSRIEATDSQGWTALFYAVSRGHVKAIEELLLFNSDVTKPDIRGHSVRQLALDKGFTDIATLVADPNEPTVVSIEDIESNSQLPEWEDMFPGIKKSELPAYFEDVKNFMYGVNLPKYIPIMESHLIGFPELLTITDGKLETMGICLPLQRRKILHSIHAYHGHRWSRRTLGHIQNEPFSIYDILYNLAVTNKHTMTITSTFQYLNNRVKMLNNYQNNDPEVNSQIEILISEREDLLKEISNIQSTIKSIRTTLNKLNRGVKKVEKNVRSPPDYITATNFKIKKFTFTKSLLHYSFIAFSVYLLLTKRSALKQYSWTSLIPQFVNKLISTG